MHFGFCCAMRSAFHSIAYAQQYTKHHSQPLMSKSWMCSLSLVPYRVDFIRYFYLAWCWLHAIFCLFVAFALAFSIVVIKFISYRFFCIPLASCATQQMPNCSHCEIVLCLSASYFYVLLYLFASEIERIKQPLCFTFPSSASIFMLIVDGYRESYCLRMRASISLCILCYFSFWLKTKCFPAVFGVCLGKNQ